MNTLKSIIAANIAALRTANNMTQLELAEKLNYTDKAISKWERGDSIPDVTVLKLIADLFGVSLDYLLEENHDAVLPEPMAAEVPTGHKTRNHRVITTLSILIVWFVATVCYVILDMAVPERLANWLPFIWAVPLTMIVWLVFNSLWFNRRYNYGIISMLMWTALGTVVLTVAAFGYWPWKLFYLGIPGQIAIYVWSRFKRRNNAE